MRRGSESITDPIEVPAISFRNRFLRNIGIGLCMGILGAMVGEIMVVQDGELLLYDWRLRNRPRKDTSHTVALVMIDDKAAGEIPQYETRELSHLAELVDFLNDHGAKAIGLDVMLSGRQLQEEGAQELQTAIRRAGKVIVSGRSFDEPTLGKEFKKPPNFLVEAAAGNGLQHLEVGAFGLVRDACIRLKMEGDQTTNSFAVLLVSLAQGRPLPESFARLQKTTWTTPFVKEILPLSERFIRINYRGPRSSVGTVDGTFPCWRADLKTLRKVDSRNFRDRIVIVGSALRAENNSMPTPLGVSRSVAQVEMQTAEVSANLVDTILAGDYIWGLTRTGRIAWFMAVGVVASLLCLTRRLLPVVLGMLVLTLALVHLSNRCFVSQNLVIPFIPTLLVPWFTALPSVATRVTLDDRQIRLLRDVFGRSVSPAIAQELVSRVTTDRGRRGAGGTHLLAEECSCSILFLDVANFTSLSENLDPGLLFKFTNELLDRLSRCVFQCEGSLIRYTGDGLIALFGRPIEREDHALLACEAAVRMHEELSLLNLERKKRGEDLVRIRIGINTGGVMVGLLGGRHRYDYSVLGDEVNVAARFERLNKDFGTTILVGEPTVRELREGFICRPLGSISLKGKTQQVSVYELVCRTGEAIPEYQREFLRLYEAGYTAIRSNRFQEAINAFNNALIFRPDDLATQKLLSRAEERTRTSTSPT